MAVTGASGPEQPFGAASSGTWNGSISVHLKAMNPSKIHHFMVHWFESFLGEPFQTIHGLKELRFHFWILSCYLPGAGSSATEPRSIAFCMG